MQIKNIKRTIATIISIFAFLSLIYLIRSYVSENYLTLGEEKYGVYLSLDYEDLPKDKIREILVIDAEYYTKREVSKLHERNMEIYSYINIGSLEDFREYFDEYSTYILGEYENWEGEYFIDVSKREWQDFIIDTLAEEIIDKGIDGFFIDNVDVYENYETVDIYDGISYILRGLKSKGMKCIVNGGDVYLRKYMSGSDDILDIMDGVNQESVFTTVDWDLFKFEESSEDTRDYYIPYLIEMRALGIDVYVIEYTDDISMQSVIAEECDKYDFTYYISDTLELD